MTSKETATNCRQIPTRILLRNKGKYERKSSIFETTIYLRVGPSAQAAIPSGLINHIPNHSLKRTFQIEKEPEKVNKILTSLRKDNHLSKTFEGRAKNGNLAGFYTNLALLNGMVIGYVKVKGKYDQSNGYLKIEVVPGNLYWTVISFCMVAIAILAYKGLAENNMFLIGSLLFLFMALGITVAFILESRSFIKHMIRVVE